MKKNKSRGKFIVIEGLDGSGASTQARSIVDYLKIRGVRAYLTKEPTDNVIGGLVRGALTGVYPLPETTLQLLFSADRGHHVARFINPVLDSGGWVVCDRYYLSTVAFGGVNLNMDWLMNLQKYFPTPDMTIILKVDPKVCVERINKDRYDVELFEKVDKLTKVWSNYETLAKKYDGNLKVINGMMQEKEVFIEIAKELEKLIKTGGAVGSRKVAHGRK